MNSEKLRGTPQFYRRAERAYLMANGVKEGNTWRRLCREYQKAESHSTASHDKDAAMRARWLEMSFNEEAFEPTELDKIREDTTHRPWIENELEPRLRDLSGGVLKGVWVFNAGDEVDPGKDQEEWDWQIGNLAANSSWLIQKLLLRSESGIAVGWGKTPAASIDKVARRFEQEYEHVKSSGRKGLFVTPTIGTPPDASPSDSEHSSTKLAQKLSGAINGTWQDCPSLANSPSVLPADLNEDERKGFLRALAGGGFKAIFGPTGSEDQKPYIEIVDTAYTSAGEFHSESFFLKQLVQASGLSLAELKALAVGDLGSALIPDERIKDNHQLEDRFNQILRLLPGIRLAHYQDIARRAAGRGSDGPAGVILLALNGNKARVVLNCVQHQAVSILVIDYHLAAGLEKLLPKTKR